MTIPVVAKDYRTWLVLTVLAAGIFFFQFQQLVAHIDQQATRMAAAIEAPEQRTQAARQAIFDGFRKQVENMHDRRLEPDSTGHQRHKLRWLYRTAEFKVYQFVAQKFGVKAALYFYVLHFTFWLIVAFIFICLSISIYMPKLDLHLLVVLAVFFYAFEGYYINVGHGEEAWTYVETGLVSAGLYFALRRNLPVFLCILVLATANRESGAAIGFIYPIINWPSRISLLPIFIGPLTIIVLNADFLSDPNFFRPSTYILSHPSRPTLFNFWQLPFLPVFGGVVKTGIGLTPLLLLLFPITNKALARRLRGVVLLYVAVPVLGSYLGNIFPYQMLLPACLLHYALIRQQVMP